MTNKDKFLKDGVVAKELWEAFQVYYYKNKSKESDAGKAFRNFFEEKAKPTLTEDKRIAERRVKMYKFTLTFIITNEYGQYGDNIRRDSGRELKQTIVLYANNYNEAIEKAKKIANVNDKDTVAFKRQLREIEWKAEEILNGEEYSIEELLENEK